MVFEIFGNPINFQPCNMGTKKENIYLIVISMIYTFYLVFKLI